MPQEPASLKDAPEHSPVVQARATLKKQLQELEALVHARLEEAAQAIAAAQSKAQEVATQPAPVANESEQWQNACRMLEEQLTRLKDENSQLHSELHQAKAQLHALREENIALQAAHDTAAAALDEAITSVETLLKEV